MSRPIRVVVVDDSPLCRVLLREILEQDGDITVVGEAADGEGAIREVVHHAPDLATVDILMPGPDGLWAVEQIMARRPLPLLVVTSQPAGPGSDLVFQAVKRGALDLAEKPAVTDEKAGAALREKVRRLARLPVVRHVRGHRSEPPAPPLPAAGLRIPGSLSSRPPAPSIATVARFGAPAQPAARFAPPLGSVVARCPIIGIGASAGGPAAIAAILTQLPSSLSAAIGLVQHLPPGFVEPFARFLTTVSPLRVHLVDRACPPSPGTVFVARDDRHLIVTPRGGFDVDESSPLGGHRPSVTMLFQSMARAIGSESTAIVLTGIGDDGAAGIAELGARGALTIAQDAASAAVYGMPEAAVRTGAVKHVLGLSQIAALLVRSFVPRGGELEAAAAKSRGRVPP